MTGRTSVTGILGALAPGHVDALAAVHSSMRPHGGLGRLVVFDGVDGSGKSTALAHVARRLQEEGIAVLATDVLSSACRSLPYFRSYATDPWTMRRAEVDLASLCCVCLGDRLMRMRTELIPLLDAGHWVLCDRYVWTPLAEMLSQGCSWPDVEAVLHLISLFPRPDTTFIMSTPGEVAIERVRARPRDRDKLLHAEFYDRTGRAFTELAQLNGLTLLPTKSPVGTNRLADAGAFVLLGRPAPPDPPGAHR